MSRIAYTKYSLRNIAKCSFRLFHDRFVIDSGICGFGLAVSWSLELGLGGVQFGADVEAGLELEMELELN